jgi:hypothetical protein
MTLFPPGRFTTSSVKSQFERSLKTFNWIVAFEAFTGGGGDGDLYADDSENEEDKTQKEYEFRLKGARSKGLDVGGLTIRMITEWYDHGWYDLFYSR